MEAMGATFTTNAQTSAASGQEGLSDLCPKSAILNPIFNRF